MRLMLSALLLWLITSQSVVAGAWVRDVKTGFLSVTTTLRQSDGILQSENSLYAEYGLWPRLTVGVDMNEVPGLAGHAMVFARLPLGAPERRLKIAVELGLGGNQVGGQWDSMVKTMLSAGRGFTSGWGDGWFNVDIAAEVRRPGSTPAFKLDATIGLSSGRRIRPLLQFESSYMSGLALNWSIIPGVLITGKNDTTWQIGLERKTARRSGIGLRFGLWRNF